MGQLLKNALESFGVSGKLPYRVCIDGQVLPYLLQVATKQTLELAPVKALGEGNVFIRQEESHWQITIEELFPSAMPPQVGGEIGFTLQILRAGGMETYRDCRWISIQRQDTVQGIRQIRVARTWAEREVSYEVHEL